ncbi:MAG TPA: AGE family epimerase/isomerase [Myxococcota bacterium]|nr:AGE family epimerase/isomerase [Myxococcota bacterium]
MEWTAARLRRHLLEELLPYWAERGADRAHGGFWNRLDGAGHALAEDHKRLLVQLRLVYAFSEGARLGAPWALELAAHGVAFLERGYRDARHGGWFLTATPDGSPLDRRKDFYAHAFAVFAYAAYHAASGDRAALARAHETVTFVRERLRDPRHGGYFEEADEAGNPLRDLPRRQNPHMHWLEALLALHAVAPDAALLADARALLELLAQRFVDRSTGGLMEHFAPDWKITDPVVEPGHHYEWTWLLAAHRDLLGPAASDPLAAQLFDYAERYGLDADLGVFDRANGPGLAPSSTKRLWPQTERVKALAARGDAPALRAALGALFARYARSDGGWIEHVDRDGRPLTDLQNATSVYHVTLALREAAAAL